MDNDNAAEFFSEADDVFGRIASRYDFLCDLFSLGIHRLWKRRMVQAVGAEPWLDLLDVASGTGDIVLRLVRSPHLQSDARIVASDISPLMLAQAQHKLAGYSRHVRVSTLNGESMPSVADASVDVFAMAFGLKICQRKAVLREALRVLRPGGRLIVLEASNIPWHWLHQVYLCYMSLCMPMIGFVATLGDASAYRYLLHGVKSFPSAERLADEMMAQGFESVSFERCSLGIVALHVARKP